MPMMQIMTWDQKSEQPENMREREEERRNSKKTIWDEKNGEE